ncbi:MAG: Rrf2 family transcriptional regulator [Acidobacteriota bacterium]|nr:Rrf2 family transcriptional regulator [Acidobacteriota bacterium]
MLSQTAEYALRAMVALAQTGSQAQTAHQIAQRTHVPLDYLSKVLNLLARAGLVTAQRGRGGGFQAGRPAGQVSVFQIIDAVDPLKRIHTCPLGLAAHGSNLCPLHRKLDDAARATAEAFHETTLASISGVTAHPLCPGASAAIATEGGFCRAIA